VGRHGKTLDTKPSRETSAASEIHRDNVNASCFVKRSCASASRRGETFGTKQPRETSAASAIHYDNVNASSFREKHRLHQRFTTTMPTHPAFVRETGCITEHHDNVNAPCFRERDRLHHRSSGQRYRIQLWRCRGDSVVEPMFLSMAWCLGVTATAN